MVFVVAWIIGILATSAFAFWQGIRALRSGVAFGSWGWRAVRREEAPAFFWMAVFWSLFVGCAAIGMLAFVLPQVNWDVM